MVIAPHQDDEVLGCGGLIGLKRQQGVPVQVVFITDGAASHGNHPKFQLGELTSIRKQEALLALEILGIDKSQVFFLDKPDGQLQYLDASDAYWGRLRQQTIEQLAQLLNSFQPGEVFVPHRQDRIKDHEVTYELTEAAVQLAGIKADVLQYPIWILWKSLLFRDMNLDELACAYRLPIHPVHSKKMQAIGAYRSQCQPVDAQTPAVLKPGFLRRFFVPYEFFFKPE